MIRMIKKEIKTKKMQNERLANSDLEISMIERLVKINTDILAKLEEELILLLDTLGN